MSANQPTLLVGVTTRSGKSEWVEGRYVRNYCNTLKHFGVTPIILSPDEAAELPNGKRYQPDEKGRIDGEILNHLHGLVLSGGGDVAPHFFGAEMQGAETATIDEARDELELNLARAALEQDIPIFGICRGCQVLNVAAGGGMIQHFDGHRSSQDTTTFHDVVVTPETRLHTIVGEETFSVNTFHHQGMDRATIAPVFLPSAVASPDEWLVEAFESPTHDWVVGVQWHPERTFELSDPHLRIWRSFLAACTYRAIDQTA